MLSNIDFDLMLMMGESDHFFGKWQDTAGHGVAILP